MGVMSAIDRAKGRARSDSPSEIVWKSLEDDERAAIKTVLTEGSVGSGKLSALLAEEGVEISKYFLEKIKADKL